MHVGVHNLCLSPFSSFRLCNGVRNLVVHESRNAQLRGEEARGPIFFSFFFLIIIIILDYVEKLQYIHGSFKNKKNKNCSGC
jgi:hypothetical protein